MLQKRFPLLDKILDVRYKERKTYRDNGMKSLLGFIFLSVLGNFAHAGCPEGQTAQSVIESLRYELRFAGDEEFSACLSVDHPDRNNDRESWGLSRSKQGTFQCGEITVQGLNDYSISELQVKSSVGFLRFLQYMSGRPRLPDENIDRAFCKGDTCFEVKSSVSDMINKQTKKELQVKAVYKNIYQGCAGITF
tara:strand:+ start:55 stop:633 length:579 start_codon:yes stop_codon:yes gene_type:complete